MTTCGLRRLAPLVILCAASLLAGLVDPALAAEGEMRWGLRVTLAAKWLDPAETEACTPFMGLYAVHDALVKPMPGGLDTPSLAESAPLEDLKLKAR